jgi:hypothetical protein
MSTNYTSQSAIDFFFDFDNATNPPWPMPGTSTPTTPPPPSQETFDAEGSVFRVAQAFFKRDFSEFEALARQAAGPLGVIFGLTTALVQKHFGDFGENLQLAFEDFAQGVLFDPRRNTEAYGFWPVHSMDALYPEEANEFNSTPFPPNGYYFWYAAVRGNSVLPGVNQQDWLQFGRYLAIAAATQNVAQPKRIVGPSAFNGRTLPPTPYEDPQNPRIAPAELNAFRDRYLPMSFEQLDTAFKTTDSRRLGPNPN